MTVKFEVTAEEDTLLLRIVKRAEYLHKSNQGVGGFDLDRMALHMDLCACHCNGCPLNLEGLLEADDFNFSHDVWGIRRHIDRHTGKLTDLFHPRFAKEQ